MLEVSSMSLKGFGAALLVMSCGSTPSSTFDGGDPGGDDATASVNDAFVSFADGGPQKCQPQTCASAGYTCGSNADGCGGVIDCGQCTWPNFCGGGGYSKCGVGVDPDGGSL